MHLVRKKLNSQRGASILLALVFFLVCSFVGAVVLGSAVTNAGKIKGQQADQQGYYAVASAARLIRDALAEVTCEGQEHFLDYSCNDADSPVSTGHKDEKAVNYVRAEAHADGKLTELLRAEAERVYRSKTEYAPRESFSPRTVTFTVEAEEMDTVEVEMTMDEDYTLTFFLRLQDPEKRGEHSMTLLCPKGMEELKEEERSSACVHTVTVRDDTEYGSHEEERSFGIVDHIRTTVIGWSRGRITKGVTEHG